MFLSLLELIEGRRSSVLNTMEAEVTSGKYGAAPRFDLSPINVMEF